MTSGDSKLDARKLWLPVGAIVTVVGTLVGAVAWLTALYSTLQLHTAQIAEIKVTLEQLNGERSDLKDRVTRIEAKIDLLLSK